MSHRIFLVEDHPIMRHSHAQFIQATSGLEFCGEAASGEEALERIPASAPDLVLIDIALPGMNGIALARRLHVELPTLPLLIVSGHELRYYVEGEFSSVGPNVKGYVMKHQGPMALLNEIDRVLNARVSLA